MSEFIVPQNVRYEVATLNLLSDGKDISDAYPILSVSIDRVVNRVPTARIVVRDGLAADDTFPGSEKADLIPGKVLEIALGYDSNVKTVFKGLIVKHAIRVAPNGDSSLTLECKSQATKLTVGRQSQYFIKSKDSDAIATLIQPSGLAADVSTTDYEHPEIVQYYTTNWDFILSRAEMNGQIVLVEDNKFKVKPPTTDDSPIATLRYGVNLLEFEAEMDARSQYSAVEAKAWSYANQQLVEVKGLLPFTPKLGDLSSATLADVLGLSSLKLHHGGRIESKELQAWANAQRLKSGLARIRGRAKVHGFPDAKPDALIELSGLGSRFNGIAYISGIRHELLMGSWVTHLQLGLDPDWFYRSAEIVEKPATGLLPGVNGLQIGVVVQLKEDPNGEDRILVKAPIIDNAAQGTWARIATLDAGNNRGSFFRPEIGDEVVLGFLNDDPRDAVVLGMLNSSAKPAPLKALDENHHKGFFTRSQMKLTFDDDKKIIVLETPGGNKITISDEAKGITLEDQNSNKIVMGTSGISIKSPKDIAIEATGNLTLKAVQDTKIEGMNVNAKANVQFKAEGNAGAEVSTSAIAILKGSLVQIN